MSPAVMPAGIGLPGLPSIGDAVTKVINDLAQAIWGFSDSVLNAVFQIIDSHTNPTLTYTSSGPLGAVYPITLWLGLVLTIVLAFLQAGRIAYSGGQGIFFFLKGIGQYVLITAAGLTVLNTLSVAANAIAQGIIKASFSVNNFQGLSGNDTFMAGAVKSLSGVALGLMSLFLVLPFAFGLLAEVLVREGSLLILAATYPIICAGLVHEKFARWYWTGLRWIFALICMTPMIAIAMAIGHSIAQGAGGGPDKGALDALGIALVSGVIANVSLVAPLVLFKMFAFIDPSTQSGQTARGVFGGSGASSGGPAAAMEAQGGDSKEPKGGGGDADGKDGMADAGGQPDTSSNPEQGAQSSMLSGVMAAVSDFSANSAAHASGSLDSIGAGHPGGPGAVASDSDDRQDQDSTNEEPDQEGSTGGTGETDPAAPQQPGNDPGAAPGGAPQLDPSQAQTSPGSTDMPQPPDPATGDPSGAGGQGGGEGAGKTGGGPGGGAAGGGAAGGSGAGAAGAEGAAVAV